MNVNATAEITQIPATPDAPLGGFGKYRLTRKLAAGGMAQIYLATIDGPQGFSKVCVLKRILPQFANLPDFAEMFITEAKIAALLQHPNIVQVFDFGRVADHYYLTMEYIDGTSLNGLMRAAARAGIPLGPRLAVHLGIPLCDALSYVASLKLPSGEPLNVVHRDVTPGNVLISNTAEVKLTDFGVVKTSVNAKSTAAGVLKGKFAYMSPEQVRHRPLDHRSDLFSLGVVLFEVATGHRLFKRPTINQMLDAVSNAEVPLPSELVRDFPEGIERILLKALAREPDDRYQSAHEMLGDLDRFRQSQSWSSGRRELSGLMSSLFPQAASSSEPSSVDASWPGARALGSAPGPSTVPSRRPSNPREDSVPSASAAMVADEEHSLPGIAIDVDDDEGGRSWWQLALLLGAAASATGAFWWLVLS